MQKRCQIYDIIFMLVSIFLKNQASVSWEKKKPRITYSFKTKIDVNIYDQK